MENKPEIEYEQVTVKVPKQIMNLLRSVEAINGDPIEDIEYGIVELIRSRIDANELVPHPKTLADKFNLNPIFQELTGQKIL